MSIEEIKQQELAARKLENEERKLATEDLEEARKKAARNDQRAKEDLKDLNHLLCCTLIGALAVPFVTLYKEYKAEKARVAAVDKAYNNWELERLSTSETAYEKEARRTTLKNEFDEFRDGKTTARGESLSPLQQRQEIRKLARELGKTADDSLKQAKDDAKIRADYRKELVGRHGIAYKAVDTLLMCTIVLAWVMPLLEYAKKKSIDIDEKREVRKAEKEVEKDKDAIKETDEQGNYRRAHLKKDLADLRAGRKILMEDGNLVENPINQQQNSQNAPTPNAQQAAQNIRTQLTTPERLPEALNKEMKGKELSALIVTTVLKEAGLDTKLSKSCMDTMVKNLANEIKSNITTIDALHKGGVKAVENIYNALRENIAGAAAKFAENPQGISSDARNAIESSLQNDMPGVVTKALDVETATIEAPATQQVNSTDIEPPPPYEETQQVNTTSATIADVLSATSTSPEMDKPDMSAVNITDAILHRVGEKAKAMPLSVNLSGAHDPLLSNESMLAKVILSITKEGLSEKYPQIMDKINLEESGEIYRTLQQYLEENGKTKDVSNVSDRLELASSSILPLLKNIDNALLNNQQRRDETVGIDKSNAQDLQQEQNVGDQAITDTEQQTQTATSTTTPQAQSRDASASPASGEMVGPDMSSTNLDTGAIGNGEDKAANTVEPLTALPNTVNAEDKSELAVQMVEYAIDVFGDAHNKLNDASGKIEEFIETQLVDGITEDGKLEILNQLIEKMPDIQGELDAIAGRNPDDNLPKVFEIAGLEYIWKNGGNDPEQEQNPGGQAIAHADGLMEEPAEDLAATAKTSHKATIPEIARQVYVPTAEELGSNSMGGNDLLNKGREME